jgi:hypothetical protein
MPASSEMVSAVELLSGANPRRLGNSLWQVPDLEVLNINSWPSITAMSYSRGGGEAIWRGDRFRISVSLGPLPPVLTQVEQGRAFELAPAGPGTLSFIPPDVTLRSVTPAARFVVVAWDADFSSALLPELEANATRFELLMRLHDPLLSQITMTLAQEVEGGFADRILVESLGTALCIRLARRFVGRLPLPTRGALSPERLQRVRDYRGTPRPEPVSHHAG